MISNLAVVALFAVATWAQSSTDFCSAYRNRPNSVVVSDSAIISGQTLPLPGAGRAIYFFNNVQGVPFAAYCTNNDLSIRLVNVAEDPDLSFQFAFPSQTDAIVEYPISTPPGCYGIEVVVRPFLGGAEPATRAFDLRIINGAVEATTACRYYSIFGPRSGDFTVPDQSSVFPDEDSFLYLLPAGQDLSVFARRATNAGSFDISVYMPPPNQLRLPQFWNQDSNGGFVTVGRDNPVVQVPASSQDRCLTIFVSNRASDLASYSLIVDSINTTVRLQNPCAPFEFVNGYTISGESSLSNEMILSRNYRYFYYSAAAGSSFTVLLQSRAQLSLFFSDAAVDAFPDVFSNQYNAESVFQMANVSRATCFAIGVRAVPFGIRDPFEIEDQGELTFNLQFSTSTAIATSSPTSSPNDPSDSDSSSSSSAPVDAGSESDSSTQSSSGRNRRTVIIAAVAGSVGGVILIAGAIFAFRRNSGRLRFGSGSLETPFTQYNL